MKKSTMLLSLVMMLSLTASTFAMQPKDKNKGCFIPPQPQQREFVDDEIMNACDADIDQSECEPCDQKFVGQKKFFNKKPWENKFEKLNLTDKQKEDLKTLKDSTKKEIIELKTKCQAKIKDLNNELFKEKYSSKEVKNISKEIKSISSKIIDLKVAKKEGMRKILTSEQYNKLFKPKTKYDMLAKRLGLSDEQKEKFIKILDTKKEKECNLTQQLREKERLLNEEFNKENIDTNAITKLSNEISNISKELLDLDINTKIELKSVLTAEQYNNYIKPRPKPVKPVKPIIYEPTDFNKSIDKK
ncbi:Spy/CpxP family protein refolding chaperone [Candidatus Ruminimicrobiellum ovillum]|uniref:Spy/CpxP family protein refolding chaperone n=1 Tax=Candidatus Ruminimicrobiellum ovillum TaxID=1947927 RepID=UPI00355A1BF9